nr:MAG TPA: hypothetical protein [Caudoviricetes sp.]
MCRYTDTCVIVGDRKVTGCFHFGNNHYVAQHLVYMEILE